MWRALAMLSLRHDARRELRAAGMINAIQRQVCTNTLGQFAVYHCATTFTPLSPLDHTIITMITQGREGRESTTGRCALATSGTTVQVTEVKV